ncbi:hypothetical protein PROFUN_13199 [Planoprotostelium fungivorum]|uniref:Uncharacterized protein n=1 Tax=Planoprotostelium fungivorum TaxID=1890364 RepID=A0A2P6N517_9EUKA|nr:hypothetical protein PROFUN_13199 [Planoprotostelium fungivorum]
MKVAFLFAIFFCLAAVRAADFADNFPQPPYNAVQTVSKDTPTSVTCPDNCGNPNSKYCYWNADIQDTCSATYAEKRSVEERQYGGCAAILACGPVCWSDGQGGTVCACVSCGKEELTGEGWSSPSSVDDSLVSSRAPSLAICRTNCITSVGGFLFHIMKWMR